MPDLEEDSDRASMLCKQAQRRLVERVTSLSESQIRTPSRLAGWSVAHVLTHLAGNADAHSRRLEGALIGEDSPKYTGGQAQRAAEIESGAARPGAEIIADLIASQKRLESAMDECSARGWPHADFLGGGHYGVGACPAHRLREVEMHHVDLGLGYTPEDWPSDYVDWDFGILLGTVPSRLRSDVDRRALMAWLAGRADQLPALDLQPW